MSGESPPRADEELAAQAQAGSLAAFEELVYRYETRLYRFLRARTGNEADARDLTQTTFVAAYRALDRFDRRRSFATWLFTITRRQLIDHWRAARATTFEPAAPQTDARDPAVILAESENHRAIWQLARRALTPDQFTALWLRYEEDQPIQEIARAMRKTGIHVKVLLHRARQKLLSHLDEDAAPQRSAVTPGITEVTL